MNKSKEGWQKSLENRTIGILIKRYRELRIMEPFCPDMQKFVVDMGFIDPTTINKWEHIARVVGLPWDVIRSGEYTIRDVALYAAAWVDKKQMEFRLAHPKPKNRAR